MSEGSSTYIGDGVYAKDVGGIVKIETRRGVHFICLGPEAFEGLMQFAIKLGWLKKGQVIR